MQTIMTGSTKIFATPRRALARGPLLLAVLALGAGCQSIESADRWVDRQWVVGDHQLPKARTDIAVRQAETAATVVFAPGAGTLSADQRDLLHRFVANSGANRGDRALIAISPAGGRGMAERRVQSIASVLHSRGLRVVRSFGPGAPDAALVSLSRLVAVPPDCPQWDDFMVRRMVDEYRPRLGCIDASSLAVTVHRPGDLVQGRPSGPSDGATLDRGLQQLRDGKLDPPVTSTGTGSPQSGTAGQSK
jgi:pilus biogenesis lipoprotein CpaD